MKNMKLPLILLVIFLMYGLVLGDFYASLETKKHLYKFEYNGLLWVALDYYTIVRYKSPDKPMQFISFQILDAK